jgi:hypothetical protein
MYSIVLTITAKKVEFDAFVTREINGENFFPIRKEEITSWGVEGMVCCFRQDSLGDLYSYEKLLRRYPSLFLKIEWTAQTDQSAQSDQSKRGLCICQEGTIQKMEWTEDELCFRSH